MHKVVRMIICSLYTYSYINFVIMNMHDLKCVVMINILFNMYFIVELFIVTFQPI